MLWNALEKFCPSRGICQGDPISSYTFVLCIEHFFHLINNIVDQKMWSLIHLSRGGPKLSHLAFADDFLLYVEANMDQVNVLKKSLFLYYLL